jgi:hypothetical protein
MLRGREKFVQISGNGRISKWLLRLVLCAMAVDALLTGCNTDAFCKDLASNSSDDDDGSAKQTPSFPTTYLDMRTTYATVPAGSLPIGFGNSAVFTALQALALANGSTFPTIPGSVTSPSRQALAVDLPLTVDVSRQSVIVCWGFRDYDIRQHAGWSPFDITSWNIGFQADVYSQNGGSIPTITWQSTITQLIPNGPTATTNFNNVVGVRLRIRQG